MTLNEPSREEIDRLVEPTMLEFGASWCGVCAATQPAIAAAVAQHPGVGHIRIEDGSGRPLGRSFGVKLWPTLVFVRGGIERERLVRPRSREEIASALQRLVAAPFP
ncbi:MAG: thioredoxin family protein [Burkholderiaceae bacterium]